MASATYRANLDLDKHYLFKLGKAVATLRSLFSVLLYSFIVCFVKTTFQ